MIEAHYLASSVEKAVGVMSAEAEKKARHCRIENKPGIEMHLDADAYISWALDGAIAVELFRDEQQHLNKAEILLLSEEVQIFTRALIGHPILLPLSYSQNLSMKGGECLLRIASKEPFADFIERLSDALSVLSRKK